MVDCDTLKTVLRGLIVSNPGVMTVHALCKDYKANMGEEVPFRQLGFGSSVELLCSLTDTLKVRGNNVYAVFNEDIAHVQSLVERSKRGRSKGKETRMRAPSGRNSSFKSPSSLNVPRRSSYGGKPQQTKLSQRRDNVLAPINENVHTYSREQYQRPNRCYVAESEYDSRYDPDKEFESEENPPYEKRNNNSPEQNSSFPLDINDLLRSNITFENETRACHPNSDSCVTPEVKKNLRYIIQQYPLEGMWCKKLAEMYLFHYGRTLDCREYGFVSMNEMARALPDVFRCVRVNDADWKLFDARGPSPDQLFTTSSGLESETLYTEPEVPAKVEERIRSILDIISKPMRPDYFNINYTIFYGTCIMDEVRGFKDLISLLKAVGNDIAVVKEVNGQTMVYPPSYGEGDTGVALPLECQWSWDVIKTILPPTACGPEDKCPEATIPESVVLNDYILVCFGEVYNPKKFWVIIFDKNDKSLDILMDELQVFYNEKELEYKAPSLLWTKGHHCAALYNGEWHRCVVLSVKDKLHVKVLYFDYGTIAVAKRSDLRLLDKRFSDLPKKAIKAKLWGITPADGAKEFSTDANVFFFNLVAQKKLVASVTKISHSPPFLALAVVDTHGGDDVHINDELVEKGFAEFTTAESDWEWEDHSEDSEEEVDLSTKPVETDTKKVQSRKYHTKKAKHCSTPKPNSNEGPRVSPVKTQSTPTTPNIDNLRARVRPPPGFEHLYNHIPPGMARVPGGNELYMNPGNQPAIPPSPLPGMPPQVAPQGSPYNNMVNSTLYNPTAFNQVPLSQQFGIYKQLPFSQQFEIYKQLPLSQQIAIYNQLLLSQQFAMYNRALQSLQPQHLLPQPTTQAGWPMNLAPALHSTFQPQVVNNNSAYYNQSKPQHGHYYTDMKASSKTATTTSSVWVPNLPVKKTPAAAEDRSSLQSDLKEKKSEESKSLSTVAPTSCAERTSKTLTPPQPPPDILPPTTPEPRSDSAKGLSVDSSQTSLSTVTESTRGKFSETYAGTNFAVMESETSEVPSGRTSSTSANSPLSRNEGCGQHTAPKKPMLISLNAMLKEIGKESTVPQPLQKTRQPVKIMWQPLDVIVGVVHLLNYRNEAYLSSDELAQVCLKLSGHSALALKLLRSGKLQVPIMEFSRKDNPEFFASLDLCPGLSEILRSKEGKFKLNLIPLKNVVSALIIAGIKSAQVVLKIQEARREFNPKDDYWKQMCQN